MVKITLAKKLWARYRGPDMAPESTSTNTTMEKMFW